MHNTYSSPHHPLLVEGAGESQLKQKKWEVLLWQGCPLPTTAFFQLKKKKRMKNGVRAALSREQHR